MGPDAERLTAHRPFLRFWSARVAGSMANQMLMVALGWQMYDLTGSAWDLGLVGLLQFIPALLLTLPAGHVCDRYDRRRVFAASLALQAVVAVTLAATGAGGTAGRGLIFATSILLGIARAFQMPSQQSIVPQLVPAVVLPRALAFSSAGTQTATIVGPAAGGWIYAAGASAVYAVSAMLLMVAVVAVAGLPGRPAARRAEPATLSSVFAGLRFVLAHRVILGAVSLDLFAVLLGGATALLPIYARDILHVGPQGLGLLRTAPAVGALALSIVLAHRPITRRAGRILFGAVAVYGVAILVFGLSTLFWLSFAALVVSGAADMVSVVVRQSLVQLETPDAMRGRVAAVNSIFIGASNQLGEFESGATAAWLGPVGSVMLGGVGTLVLVATWIRLFPPLRDRDRLVPDAPG